MIERLEMTNTNESLTNIDSVDLYVNYVCGLRCNHCFVGEQLNSNIEMPLALAKSIVEQSKAKGVKTITLLGGEPTLYSEIIALINYIIDIQIEVRIVTNGQKSFQNIISKLPQAILYRLHICFSIDGSTSTIHDFIRGKGVFSNLIKSINLAQSKNISFSGITSISKDNYHDAFSIITLCSSLNLKYLNVHYITDRGFAKNNKVVSVHDWMQLCKALEGYNANIPIRIEKTFVPFTEKVNCEVTKKANIIIDPSGKIYGCTMFMNFENIESGTWTSNGIKMNNNAKNENCVCKDTSNGCPAMPLINNGIVSSANSENLKVDCIFNKTTI